METKHIFMRTLVIMVVMAPVIWTTQNGRQKVDKCCKKVSADEVTDPIIGYRLQNRNLPCVKAVILETQSNLLCISPRAPWVREKIRQFKKAQKDKLHLCGANTTPTSSSSISNITHGRIYSN